MINIKCESICDIANLIKVKRLLSIIVLLFLSYDSYATHLVGGELNYEYLGGEEYYINLTVYRDCYLGMAEYDSPAYILVYEANGDFLGVFSVFGEPETRLSVELDNDCYKIPPDVCVEKKEYSFVGELPKNESGYYLSYQRCCRNNSIINIIDDKTDSPGDSGMNLFAFIPPATQVLNANPVFNNYPPVAICANMPLVFDHGAVDAEGDSLVYKLCMPTDALSPGNPAFNWGNYDALPFADVRFRSPYSFDDFMGGEEKLKIDSKTGLLTGYPTKIGQFVVGVCVEDYRNGELISFTKRDFQFNVAECRKASVASFFTYDTICNSLVVEFKNESDGADEYSWIVSDGTTSSDKDLVHTFPNYGTYDITLIALNSIGCSDTVSKTIVLREEDFFFEIEDVEVCKGEEAKLELLTSNTELIKNVYWQIDPSKYTSGPMLKYLPEQTEEVEFEITTINGCRYWGGVDVIVHSPPDFEIEVSDSLIFTPQSILATSTSLVDHTYQWEAKGTIATPLAEETFIYIEESQWVYLTVTDPMTGCSSKDSIYVIVETCDLSNDFELNRDVVYGCDEVLVKYTFHTDLSNISFQWLVGGDSLEDTIWSHTIPYDSSFYFQLIVTQEDYCSDTINYVIDIDNPYILITELKDKVLCEEQESVEIDLGIVSTVDYIIFLDSGDSLLNTDKFTLSLIEGEATMPFVLMYNDSCIIKDTVRVSVSQQSVKANANPVEVVKGEATYLTAEPNNYDAYQWYPAHLPMSPNAAETSVILEETTEFVIQARDEWGCLMTDTILVRVIQAKCNSDNIFIPTAFTPNGDGMNDVWLIRSKGDNNVTVAIYNRWGERVFATDDINRGWDGTYKGKEAEAGSYAYYLTVICENQKQYFSKGNITLIR